MKTLILDVPGITCDHCARAVEDAVASVEGVASACVDLASGTVRVSLDDPTDQTADLREAILRAGFQVNGCQSLD